MMLQPATGLKKAMHDEALSEQHFAIIQKIAQKEAGLLLPASKRAMVQSRLSRRIRTIGYDNIPAYISLLAADHEERSALISVLTTNVTSFFREVHHFHTLAKEALPPLLDRAKKG